VTGRPAGRGAGRRATREQVLAFRLASHQLSGRLPPGSLSRAAAACGIQETPHGTASLALAARVDGLTPEEVERALGRDRSLLAVWAMRGAPHLLPTADLQVFTAGAVPADEASFAVFLGGWAQPVADAGIPAAELAARLAAAARTALDGRRLLVDDLRGELWRLVPELADIRRPPAARADMPEPLFRTVGLAGVACIAGGRGDRAELVRSDQWLGRPPAAAEPERARAELVRRYLHCHGPSTPAAFAAWTLRSPADARAAFALVEPELAEVDTDDGRAVVLAADADAFADPPAARGVRLLPTQDPFLQQRDRATLLPDPALRRRLWRPVGGPGLLLLDGRPAATWRLQVRGRRLQVTVEPFGSLPAAARAAVEAEAERLAAFRGATTAQVTVGA
jgi:Winged helix DNA-binding domain